MAVRTNVTASDVVRAFDKWGVKYAPYRSDWATHNRNDKGAGWGPITGVMVHNFASNIADASSERYLWDGDSARGMPGPLSQLSIRDDGTVGLIGWGRANHGGTGTTVAANAIQSDAMPLKSELRPASAGTVDMNSRLIGIEMLYGGNKATQAQRDAIVLVCAALIDMLGPGYTAGSVIAHRESTNTRSDPEGFNMATLRQQINARLKAGATSSKPGSNPPIGGPITPPQEPDVKLSDIIARNPNVTVGQALVRGANAYDALFEKGWFGARFVALGKLVTGLQAQVNALKAEVDALKSATKA